MAAVECGWEVRRRPVPGRIVRLAVLYLLPLGAVGCAQRGDNATPKPVPRCANYPMTNGPALEDTIAFQGGADVLGQDKYPVFRIPSLVTTASGALVAFAEARQSLSDPGAGQIAVVMKRSLDCGRTWSAVRVLADHGTGDAHNPTAVVVPRTGVDSRLWLFYNQRPKSAGGEFDIAAGLGPDSDTIWTRWSDDDGETWSAPRALTADVKDPKWGISAMGPGRAIVTRWGRGAAPAGRIVVPGWYTQDGQTGSFVFFSDDNGTTWQRGGLPEPGTDESQVVELTDGAILLDGRQGQAATDGKRRIFRSEDGGQTWSTATPGIAMVPVMSSVIRYSATREGDDRDRLLHSGVSPQSRSDARVWISHDEAQTWADESILAPGFAQYTVLTVLDDGSLGMAYESLGADTAGISGFNIHFARFNLAQLHEDADK